MTANYGIRWDDGKRIQLTAALLAALVALAAFVGMKAEQPAHGPMVA